MRRRPLTPAAGLVVAVVAVALIVPGDMTTPSGSVSAAAPTTVCLPDTSPASLDRMLDPGPGGLVAADYQRATRLPDGRILWLFQDATVELPPPRPGPDGPTGPEEPETHRLLHNVGLLQSGSCFTLLRSGTPEDPRPWLFPNETVPFGHWFWPLDAEMGSDGRLYVFVAEMIEQGSSYLQVTTPISTRVVGVGLSRLDLWYGGPGDRSASLYGFSITSDARWTYLYSHCHRQFGHSTWPLFPGAHDFDCVDDVYVARVRRGQVLDPPAYWDGGSWQSDPRRAVSVSPTGRAIAPSQVRWSGGEFVAVTKDGDWFGDTILFSRAPNAQGPWTTYARVPAVPKCDRTVCNTYFASWIPLTDGRGNDVIGLSHNVWGGELSWVNRPSYLGIAPPGPASRAGRCSLVDC
jgi:hypothetical protein